MKTYRKLIEDKKWIQKATKNMRKDKPCTGEKFGSETCPPGSKRYNLAKTFRKMAKEEANTPEPPKKEADDPSIKSGKKKEAQLKKRVLMQKLRAVRSGVEGIVAHHEPEGELIEGKKKGLWDNIHAKRKRGEKPAKPGDKDYPKTLNVEGAAWTKKSGKNPEGGLNEKGRKSYERENPGSDLKAPQPEGGSRKKSFCARMKGMRKRQKPSNNTGKDRLSLSLKKWKCNEDKALDFVKRKIEKEVGKSGYGSKDNPRKPQTAAEKAKVRAHQAKVDKENAAERKKDPSQGRYPKG